MQHKEKITQAYHLLIPFISSGNKKKHLNILTVCMLYLKKKKKKKKSSARPFHQIPFIQLVLYILAYKPSL